jgi:hypothetical protein
MKKLLLLPVALLFVACDRVDISKYPEDVQICYNDAIYDKDNCTESKKIVVKYCQCVSAKKAAIKAQMPDESSASYGIRMFVERHKIREECAEKTGYTFCKTEYEETGLLCEDAEHNSGEAQITLDVDATKENANVVVNGEHVVLKSEGQRDSTYISYYGTNSVGEQVKLNIIFTDNEKNVEYMLGINSDESTYGCFKK